MKKNKFLNGISAKLALAMVTLTVTIFTSCEKESIAIDVDTTPVNAQLYIQAVVFAPDGTNVTNLATITFSDGSNGQYEGTTIEAKTVTVTATYNNMSGSTTVTTPAVASAHSYTTTAFIILSYNSSELKTILVDSNTTIKEATDVYYYYDNTSDYWLTISVPYTKKVESTVTSSYIYVTDSNGAIAAEIASYNVSTESEESVPCYVGATSRLNAYLDTETTVNTYNVVLKSDINTVVATFNVEQTANALRTTGENDIPGHGHSTGHGHGHGDDANAGGGIINAD